jgi:prophage regulatory protein
MTEIPYHFDSNLERLLTLTEVLRLTSLSRATIYRNVGLGLFPAPIRISRNRSGWRLSELMAAISQMARGGAQRPPGSSSPPRGRGRPRKLPPPGSAVLAESAARFKRLAEEYRKD